MEARRRQYMQPLRVPHAPTRLEHNRLLPPLADQPYLELRRPSFKDACFTTSALSPCWVGKRYGGEWDAASTRTSLLDRYLSQDEQPTPYSHDLAPSPIPQTPILNDISNALPHPSNSKKFWVYRAAQKAALENPNKSITMRSDCVATPPLIIPPPSVSYFSPDTATEPEELVSAVETPINDDTQSEPATPLSRTPMEMLTERAMISGGLDSRFPPLPSRYHFPPSSRIQETDFDTSSVRSLPISTREQHDPIDGRIKLIRSQTLDAVPPQRAQRVQKRRPPPLKIISAISDIDSPPSTD
ncbi:hypothetical protein EJ08DRAFT_188177 [Tothia fuscella]|uniref:Uncharacterized protein n=1 Tax=Tothia fuscella TaxID=1048955 RepID=A0A9P4NU82_9PEZI|nr:hypothetical protein EJ08DRAFT_188177 [Tothia fuscella]